MEPQQNPQPSQSPPAPATPTGSDNQSPSVKVNKPNIVYVGFVLAVMIPLAGLIVSVIARRRVIEKRLPGKNLALAGIIIGGILTAINTVFLVFMIWLFAALGGFHGNGAQSASKSLTGQIEKIGAKKICSNGDNGYSIDNTTPWYDIYYEAPDSPELTTKIKNIAAGQGYQLRTDTQAISQLQQNSQYALSGDEQYVPGTDYLTGTNGDRTLTIQINRNTEVSLACDTGQYGRKQAAGNGTAIIDLLIELPETNR